MTSKTLSRITEVAETISSEEVNDWLKEGAVLLAVASVPIHEGADSFVRTKYVVGYPGRDPLDD